MIMASKVTQSNLEHHPHFSECGVQGSNDMNEGDVYVQIESDSIYAKVQEFTSHEVRYEIIDTENPNHISTVICSIETFEKKYRKIC
ncbi:hypothetical protein GCM10017161_41010 [Thalassotalea marina]|uniref:Uncharacterized protein n=2 Tax=Thalassotalea marina TaxID=1673741 RepID=A0A919EQ85_9GAMM|nr:hypothetical protein GCM10017161_41010 [Thalassotalea marina]